ncbi:MAG: DUF3387 domain-containing protein [Chitinophagia bacterium]|nr:DUF3387 domain-containing protein [Chitinophagia bacterium]
MCPHHQKEHYCIRPAKSRRQEDETHVAGQPDAYGVLRRYQKIIEEYNKGKSLEDTMRSFDRLNDFIQDLNVEDARAMRENLTDESLAIFDLLRSGKELTPEELKDVKKIAAGTLNDLKNEKLRIDRWRESRQVQAQVKTMIFNAFQWLPQRVYTDDDVASKTMAVYQHIYTNYPGGHKPKAYA